MPRGSQPHVRPPARARSLWRFLGVPFACGIAAACFADTLQLSSGETLVGEVISEDGSSIVFESAGLGKVKVPRDRIARIVKEDAAVAKAAPAPGAQEPTAPEAQPGEAVAQITPAPAEKKKKREDLLRLWWEDNLRYQFYQPITVPMPFSGGERTVGEDVRISGRAGLRMSVDAADFISTGGEPPAEGGIEMRTFRLYTNGEFGAAGPDRTQYALQFGLVGGDFYMSEGWLRWRGIDYVRNVQAGYMTAPQTLENIYPFGSLTLMEAASLSLAFSPGNRMGIQIDRTFDDGRVYAVLGMWSVGSDPGLNLGSTTQSLLMPILRVTGLPILEDHGALGKRLLHLGMSVSYTLAAESQVRYRAQPESFIAPYLTDTGDIDATSSNLGGLELIYMDGPLTIQSEAAMSRVGGKADDYTFGGAYVSAGWVLTGEQRGYDKRSGSLTRLVPRTEFSRKNKTWGAWELAARASYLDLSSGSIRGGRMKEAMLGVNWYWDRNLRWMFNYGYAIAQEGPSPGNLQIFQLRLQVAY